MSDAEQNERQKAAYLAEYDRAAAGGQSLSAREYFAACLDMWVPYEFDLQQARAHIARIETETKSWIDDLIAEGGARKVGPLEHVLAVIRDTK